MPLSLQFDADSISHALSWSMIKSAVASYYLAVERKKKPSKTTRIGACNALALICSDRVLHKYQCMLPAFNSLIIVKVCIYI